METSITDLIGKTFIKIDKNGDEIIFTCTDGSMYKMSHTQDCNISVNEEDDADDFNDLIGYLIVKASEYSSNDIENPEDIIEKAMRHDAMTWTFYIITTTKGTLRIHWYGDINEDDSERADFIKL